MVVGMGIIEEDYRNMYSFFKVYLRLMLRRKKEDMSWGC